MKQIRTTHETFIFTKQFLMKVRNKLGYQSGFHMYLLKYIEVQPSLPQNQQKKFHETSNFWMQIE